MDARGAAPVVLQSKFSAWLSWSQPFVHQLVTNLDAHTRNVVLCNRTEHLDLFPAREVCRLAPRYLFQPTLAAAASVHLRDRYGPDLIHAHFGWSGLRMLLVRQMLRIPLIVTFGGRDLGLQSSLPEFQGAYRALFETADAVICVSQDLAARAAAVGIPEERIHTIYRGADLSQFQFVERKRPDSEPVALLMVGRLTDKKGHTDALEALRRVLDSGAAAELTIVGEGDEEGRIRTRIRELNLGRFVRLVGSTDHEGVKKHMWDADVLLHPARTTSAGDVEGVPNVVVEAQATGLPTVATLHGGIPEVIVPGETGELVAERDTEALAAALLGLIEDPVRRLAYGAAASRRAHERFDSKRQVEAHVALYHEVIDRAQSNADWRVDLPDDMMERLQPLVGVSAHAAEYSLAELVDEWATPTTNLNESFESSSNEPIERSDTLFDRVYRQKGRVPTWIKYPVKRALGNALTRAIAARHGSSRMIPIRLNDEERVLDYFRAGGTLPVDTTPDTVIKWLLRARS
jgi:glycosyltransferase involved in cell wall biosynthesis